MRYKMLLTLCFSISVIFSIAQSTDELFEKAKILAKQKQYDKAEQICNDILAKDDNGDIRFYLGLLYSWNGQYDDARRELSILRKSRPNSAELITAQYNVEVWADNNNAAIQLLDTAIANNPDNLDFLMMRAKAYNSIGNRKSALTDVRTVLAKDPALLAARNLYLQILSSNRKNAISTSFTYDWLNNGNKPSYSGYLQYGRKIPIGTVIGRVNYANRFSKQGYQEELDTYLSFWKGGYTYANIGYSNSSLFPDHRAGFEYYQSLPKAFETSLGFRYLKFGTSDVILYTGTVGKYVGNYWFSLRPQINFRSSKASYSFRLTGRKYFDDAFTYVSIDLFYGTAPDFNHPNIQYSYFQRLRSFGGAISFNKKIGSLWIVNGKYTFERDEIIKNSFQNERTIDVGLSKLF